jgi:tripartite-type tricarboxylate transporter receptor subunit TctC
MGSFRRNSSWLSGLMVGLLALLIVGSTAAQTTYPEKPIRIVVGVPSGSLLDTIARELGQKFAESLGKPVVIQNVPGAAGNIAANRKSGIPKWAKVIKESGIKPD